MIKDTDAAYIAGFVDADGCISVGFSDARRGGQLTLQIANTDLEVLEWIQSLFPNGNIFKDKRRSNTKKYQNTYYILTYSGLKSKFILEIILPFLRVKEIRCRLALDFISEIERSSFIRGKRLGLDPESLSLRYDIADSIRNENRKIS